MRVSQETLDQIALSWDEYSLIIAKLGREPTNVELGMFGALWSEHCGYKYSKELLRLFPTKSNSVIVEAGEENAGMIEIGDGLRIVFKVESHNHPSAVEPVEGAATGVGGVIRDILAMGARPIALLNSLRFGPIEEPHNRFLFNGVIQGISSYGNCVGIPDVGGEISFSSSYNGNPLVNAMCVGILKEGELVRAAATTPNNVLMLVGARTGRDGIHGASGLASRTFESEEDMRPTVQVGDPFMEKLLIEACLEVAKTGYLEGMQDLGAAGLTSSAIESASKGNSGIEIDISLVPRREKDMTAYEVMLSESQERMLLIVKQGRESLVQQLFNRWDLDAVSIGKVTEDQFARIYDGDHLEAEVPIPLLIEAPRYRTKSARPEYLNDLHSASFPVEPKLEEANSIFKLLLSSPNIASRRPVYRQYDHEVQTSTIVKPGQGDAAVLRIRETAKGIAAAVDGNGRFAFLEPYVGGAMAVAEACRNIVCAGARPIAVTDCLNFGDPSKSDVYYQLEQAVRGMAEACRTLEVPVVSGNVSLYNETQGQPIFPTPVVGAIGILEDVNSVLTAGFKRSADVVLLLGVDILDEDGANLAGSEYLSYVHKVVAGCPSIDLNLERQLQDVLQRLTSSQLLNSAHDCSEGGLGITLAESCIIGDIGFEMELEVGNRWDIQLFGEQASRVVVSVSSENETAAESLIRGSGLPFVRLGTVGGSQLIIRTLVNIAVVDLKVEYFGGLERAAG